jgi:hypothetical protein
MTREVNLKTKAYFFAPGLGAGLAGCPLDAIFAVPPS